MKLASLPIRLNPLVSSCMVGQVNSKPVMIVNPAFLKQVGLEIVETIAYHEKGHVLYKHIGKKRRLVHEIRADWYASGQIGVTNVIRALDATLKLVKIKKVRRELVIRKWILGVMKGELNYLFQAD